MATTNWRRELMMDLNQKKSVVIGSAPHRKLQQVSQETGMSMQFWADAFMRFGFAHVMMQRMIEAAKGVTLQEFHDRERAIDKMIYELIEEGAVVTHAVTVSPLDEPPVVAKEPEPPTKGAQLANGALRLAQVREQRRQKRRQEMSPSGALGRR